MIDFMEIVKMHLEGGIFSCRRTLDEHFISVNGLKKGRFGGSRCRLRRC